MTKKSEARLLRDLRAEKSDQVPRVDEDTLQQLVEAKETALLVSMEAQEADLTFRRLVANACRSQGQPIDRSIVCLSCGLVRPVASEQCPDCTG